MNIFRITAVILLLFLIITNICWSKNFSISTEFGLGNLLAVYGSCNFNNTHSGGLGCGYLYYNDDEDPISLNIISPSLLYSVALMDLFTIRARIGIDYVSRNQMSYIKRSYTLAPDFLVKVIKFRASNIYAGISIPVVIGETSNIDTLIGAGYHFIF